MLVHNLLSEASFDPWAEPKFWLDVADKAIKALALMLGGAWTVVNYFRGRTFAKRLEFAHYGRVVHLGGRGYLVVRCEMKNLGLSKLNLRQTGTGCELYELAPTELNPPPTVKSNYFFSVFTEHHWIESQEQLFHEEMISLDEFSAESVAVRLRLTIVASRPGRKAITWETS
jgi:hypothetical protein